MFRIASSSSASSVAKRAARNATGLAVLGTTGSVAAYYLNTESGAGFRRECRFWSKVGPIVFDYYWHTGSKSPLVRYRKWKRRRRRNDEGGGGAIDDDAEEEERERSELLSELHERHAPEMLNVMLDLKGLYVKLGQVLSVTALPVPEPYRKRFRTLQSDVPGWESFDAVVKPTLEREFGRKLDDVFESVDPVPCGAASIGQAHRAKIKSSDDGANGEEDVIVKVQYPDAAWKVPADIECVGDFMKLCVWAGVVDESSAKLSYEEFARQFLAELDYRKETSNLKEVYESSLDPNAPYIKRNVVVPRVYEDLCTDKVITMTYLPGPKLEEEAKRQLALLGIDTSKKDISSIVRDAAKDASADVNEPESGELVRRVTKRVDSSSNKSPFSWKVAASRTAGRILGVDALLWAARSARRIVLWYQAAAVSALRRVPSSLLPLRWRTWAEAHETASAQAARLNLTERWIDALFDVHGHQIFNLGLFNADPHPGNILVVEEEEDDSDSGGGNDAAPPSTKLGLIDYGQCKRLTERERTDVARLVLAVADDRPDAEIADAFRAMDIKTTNDSTEFLATFGRLMFGPLKPEHFDHGWHRRLHSLDRVTYFPRELSMVYRTSLLLRGLGVSLQLNYSVGDRWRTHAKEALERRRSLPTNGDR